MIAAQDEEILVQRLDQRRLGHAQLAVVRVQKMARHLPVPDAVAFAKEAGRKYINSYNVPVEAALDAGPRFG